MQAHDSSQAALFRHHDLKSRQPSPTNAERSPSFICVVRGEEAILALQPLLIQFSEACGQPGIMQDLPYFLQKPGLLKRVPYLYLVTRREGITPKELCRHDLVGSLLLLEYRILRLRTRAYATNDRSGRGTLLAAPEDRLYVATRVCETLMARDAAIAMLSFLGSSQQNAEHEEPGFSLNPGGRRAGSIQWAMQRRSAPAYLQLKPTLDETLAGLGQKTRSHMRYYRRRAERELACTPVAHVEATTKELVQFNRECMYPVDSPTVRWRLQVLHALKDGFLMGMKDGEGRWLSILAGRRFGETSEILWQMNRAGYSTQSLGTVMRVYCIEQELQRGATRLQVEGGTFHSMHHSFVREDLIDLVVMRSSAATLIRRLGQYFVRRDNRLAGMLKSDSLQWHIV